MLAVEQPRKPGEHGKSITEFLNDSSFIRVLVGGRGCIHGDTTIYDPVDRTLLSIRERSKMGREFHVWALDQFGRAVIAEAGCPFLKGHTKLLRFHVEGRQRDYPIRVSRDHKFLTGSGVWTHAKEIRRGSEIGHSNMLGDAKFGSGVTFYRITSVRTEREESDFYDLTVPSCGNYLAEGVWHHNSAKTSALAEDCIGHIWQNAGAKVIIARETETSQSDSSISTFELTFSKLGPLYANGGLGLFKVWNNGRTFRIPSYLAIKRMQEECKNFTTRSEIAHWIITKGDALCGYIEFRGLPSAEKGKFRGMECSYLGLVEADQIVKRQFDLSLACLRWKGSDPETCDEKGFIKDRCVVLDTNPPGKKHWIAELEAEEMNKPESERVMRFWHISTYENEHNLPDNYIRDTILLPYENNPAMIDRMLYGQYADAFDGKPVYHNFRHDLHTGENLEWPKGALLVRGWDFGTCNAVTWSAYWAHTKQVRDPETNKIIAQIIDEYWHVLHEQYLEGADTDQQTESVIKTTGEEFPFWNDRAICAGVIDVIDPAGANSNFGQKVMVGTRLEKGSCLAIIQSHGIFPAFNIWERSIQAGTAIINRLLRKRDRNGQPCFRIDRKNCPMLTAAFSGGYRYPQVGENGYGGDVPMKGGDPDFSHISDSLRYPLLYSMKLLRMEHEKPNKPNLPKRHIANPNPRKKFASPRM